MTTTALPEAWGRRLRKLRRDQEVTVTALAEAARVSRKHIHEIESGKVNASDEVRIRIAAALGVEVGSIFDYKAAG